MHVTILYFAALRECAGRSSERLDLPEEVNDVGKLLRYIEGDAPLRGKLGSVRVAVNEEFRDEHHPLLEGDTIALIPPVSGG